jgi:hypothetical protein
LREVDDLGRELELFRERDFAELRFAELRFAELAPDRLREAERCVAWAMCLPPSGKKS